MRSSRRRPRVHPTAQAEIHGVRSYRSGDNPRLIHWRTSARRGELMVRELEDVPSDNLLVIVDPTHPQPLSHRPSLEDHHPRGKSPAEQARPGKGDLLRH